MTDSTVKVYTNLIGHEFEAAVADGVSEDTYTEITTVSAQNTQSLGDVAEGQKLTHVCAHSLHDTIHWCGILDKRGDIVAPIPCVGKDPLSAELIELPKPVVITSDMKLYASTEGGA